MLIDWDQISDPDSKYPNMMPSVERFTAHMKLLGVQRTHQIVVYDQIGVMNTPRFAFMLRFFGADNVRILNGGIKKWIAEGRPFVSDVGNNSSVVKEDGDYSYFVKNANQIIDYDQMCSYAKKGDVQIVDTRSASSFDAGSIPGSLNIPYILFSNEDATILNADQLRTLFDDHKADPNLKSVATCQIAMSAAIADLSIRLLGNEDVQIYDGSWSEWSDRHECFGR